MAISKEIYSVMEAVVGSENTSDDPVICEGYRSGPGGYENGLGHPGQKGGGQGLFGKKKAQIPGFMTGACFPLRCCLLKNFLNNIH